MVPEPLSGARPLGDGVGSGDLGYGSLPVGSRLQGQIRGMGFGAPRSHIFVKVGARAPVPYGVGATVA